MCFHFTIQYLSVTGSILNSLRVFLVINRAARGGERVLVTTESALATPSGFCRRHMMSSHLKKIIYLMFIMTIAFAEAPGFFLGCI